MGASTQVFACLIVLTVRGLDYIRDLIGWGRAHAERSDLQSASEMGIAEIDLRLNGETVERTALLDR